MRKLTKEFSREAKRGLKLPRSLKQKLVYEILHSLQSVNNTNVTEQRGGHPFCLLNVVDQLLIDDC